MVLHTMQNAERYKIFNATFNTEALARKFMVHKAKRPLFDKEHNVSLFVVVVALAAGKMEILRNL